MARRMIDRKSAFKAALAVAGMTVTEWCEAQGISRPHLYQTLDGLRDSARLMAKVDGFVAEHLPEIGVKAAA